MSRRCHFKRRWQAVAELPGFTCGLALAGRYAFVGLSKVRASSALDGVPLAGRRDRLKCSVAVVDLQGGQIVALLEFQTAVEEIFHVQLLPGLRFPEVVGFQKEAVQHTFIVPAENLRPRRNGSSGGRCSIGLRRGVAGCARGFSWSFLVPCWRVGGRLYYGRSCHPSTVPVPPVSEVTRILSAIEEGDPHAAEQLLPLVYDELRKLAAAKLAREKPGQTLDATALVHEAYFRLVGTSPEGAAREWQGRAPFFAAAAEAMRRILVERARRKRRHKHGGGLPRADVELDDIASPMPDEELLALDEAMTRLAAEDPVRARLVQLRFYAGLSNDEAAGVLGISAVTAKRYWRYARAWLHREVSKGDDPGP
jgi:RNA polymerase sigma factor (TIGR02999 family)